MNLSEAQRKYLVRDQIIGGGVFNALISALLGWLTFRQLAAVPMHGEPSILSDVIATSVLLPLFICVIATPLVHKAMQAGKVLPLHGESDARTMLLWLPGNSLLRGVLLALAALATCAPVLLGSLLLFGVTSMSVGGFAVLKLFYAGILAAAVSPIVALYAMASAAPSGMALDISLHGSAEQL
jgi:hypothetical protein